MLSRAQRLCHYVNSLMREWLGAVTLRSTAGAGLELVRPQWLTAGAPTRSAAPSSRIGSRFSAALDLWMK